MNEQIGTLMDEELINQLEKISELQIGTEEHGKAVDNFAQLYKLRIEQTKNEQDDSERYYRREQEHKHFMLEGELKEKLAEYENEAREREEEFKKKQLAEQVEDRKIKVMIAGAELLIPLTVYCVLFCIGLNFEKTGVVGSGMFKRFMNYIKPTKK